MKIKLMSFNIQHGRNFNFPGEDRIDFHLMAETIASFGADIVGLNEVRGLAADLADYPDLAPGTDMEAEKKIVCPEYAHQAREIASLLGYNYFFAPSIYIKNHGLYGNALLSRFPISDGKIIPIPKSPEISPGKWYEARSILRATVHTPKPLAVFVTHFGLCAAEADSGALTAVQALSEETGYPKVFMGDLNLPPESPILDRIRIIMADTADMFEDLANKKSYPSDNPAVKIDYIFVSDDIKVLNADIPAVVASDHRPHTATVEL